MNKQITISSEEYSELIMDSRKLNALENGGVDNWSGIGYALEEFHRENNINEAIDDQKKIKQLQLKKFIEDVEVDISEYADVDYPAGIGAGHNISIDTDRLTNSIEKFILLRLEQDRIDKEEIEKLRELQL